jgi:hypothetical protein
MRLAGVPWSAARQLRPPSYCFATYRNGRKTVRLSFQQAWQRVLSASPLMNKMNANAIDFGTKMIERVETLFLLSPIDSFCRTGAFGNPDGAAANPRL